MRKTDEDYNWAEDTIASYALAIKMLRERYHETRLKDESAKEWLQRTGQQRFVTFLCNPMHSGATEFLQTFI